MHFNWIPVALPFAALLYCVWVICRLKPTAHLISHTDANLASGSDLRMSVRSKRTIKWMSPGEFETIIGKFQDVIFIDLLPNYSERPRPFQEARVLFIEPDGFHDVLRWAPPSSCNLTLVSSPNSALVSLCTRAPDSAPHYNRGWLARGGVRWNYALMSS
jgi:hypothetical protein